MVDASDSRVKTVHAAAGGSPERSSTTLVLGQESIQQSETLFDLFIICIIRFHGSTVFFHDFPAGVFLESIFELFENLAQALLLIFGFALVLEQLDDRGFV